MALGPSLDAPVHGPTAPYPTWTPPPPRPPGPPPPPILGEVARPADAVLLAVSLASGLVVDLTMHTDAPGLALAVLPLALGLAVRFGRRPTTASARRLAELGGAPALLALVRADPAIVATCTLAALGLVALAASLGEGGRAEDLSFASLAQRALLLSGHLGLGGGFAARALGPLADGRKHWLGPAARGLAVAVPVVLVLGGLLAAGDPAIGALLDELSLGFGFGHVVGIAFGAWLAAGLLRAASTPVADLTRPAPVGRPEARVVVAAVVAVLAAFTVVQVVVAAGGADAVLHRAGLTYADHARSGFFQLLAAAGFVLVVLLAARAVADPRGEDGVLAALGAVACGLTAIVALAAAQRLRLYEDAFGLTLLRLWTTSVALAIAAAAVLVGLRLGGLGRGSARPWTTPALLALAVLVPVGLGLADPAAVVAERNLDRARAGKALDADYLAGLGPDALPTIERAWSALPEAAQADLRAAICTQSPLPDDGVLEANLARSRARTARARLCGPTSSS